MYEDTVVERIAKDRANRRIAIVNIDTLHILILARYLRHAMNVILAPVIYDFSLRMSLEVHFEAMLDILKVIVWFIIAGYLATVVSPFWNTARFTLRKVGIDAALYAL